MCTRTSNAIPQVTNLSLLAPRSYDLQASTSIFYPLSAHNNIFSGNDSRFSSSTLTTSERIDLSGEWAITSALDTCSWSDQNDGRR